MDEIAQQAEAARQNHEQQAAREQQREAMLTRILTPEARERLSRISLVNPDKARGVGDYLLGQAQMGRLDSKVSDARLVEILEASGASASAAAAPKVTFKRKGAWDDDGVDNNDEDVDKW